MGQMRELGMGNEKWDSVRRATGKERLEGRKQRRKEGENKRET